MAKHERVEEMRRDLAIFVGSLRDKTLQTFANTLPASVTMESTARELERRFLEPKSLKVRK